MNKLLIKNKEVFQGEKYLYKNKNYFEGWYFKNTFHNKTISFIPGINIYKDKTKAFIQVLMNHKSYFFDYDIEDFKYNHHPFFIKIGNNYFSKERIHLNIYDKKRKVFIQGDLTYSNSISIRKNLIQPNIMGPFSYLPFMECNHAILHMKNEVNGFIKINKKEFIFDKGTGYIEKDWGSSFPKSYIWIQGNQFKKKDASFMLSIANIPLKVFSFTGVICVLIIAGKEYRFTTYNHCKIIKYKISNEMIQIVLKQKDYILIVQSFYEDGKRLLAPVKGKMEKDVLESVSAEVSVTLKKKEDILFFDTSTNCGLELVKK